MTPRRRRSDLITQGNKDEQPEQNGSPDQDGQKNAGGSDENNFNQPKEPDDRGGFYHKEFNTPEEQEAERRAPPADRFVGEGVVAQHFIAHRALVGLGYVRHSERFQFMQDFPLTRKRGVYAHAAMEFLKIKHRDGVTRWTLATEPFSKGYEAVGLVGTEVIDQQNIAVGGENQWRTVSQVTWSITPTMAVCSRLGLMLRPNGRTKSDILLEVKRNGVSVMVDYRMPFDELSDRAGQLMNLWLPMVWEPNAIYTFRMHTEDGSTFDYFDPVPNNVPYYILRAFDMSWLQDGVKIVDYKTVDDFSSITGNRNVELSLNEKRALLDSNLATSYTLEPEQTLTLTLKRAHRVHDIKVLGGNGQVIEADGALLIWETVLDDMRIAEKQLFAEVKDEITEIYIYNGTESDIDISEVLIEQFSDSRVHAPVHQPLNVNIRDEVVLEDIERIELHDGRGWVRNLTADEVRALFDKTVMNGEYYLVPDFHFIRIIFKKPQQVQEIESLIYNPGQNGDIAGAQAIPANYRIYSPDSTFTNPVIETSIPTYNLEIKRKVSTIDIDFPDPLNGGGGIPIWEVMIKKFTHTDQEAPTVEISQRKHIEDIAYAYLGETPVPVADLAKLFDGECSTYVEIPIGVTLTVMFKLPNRVHGIKVLDELGAFFVPGEVSVSVLYPHYTMPYATVHDGAKEIIVKEEIIGLAVTYSSPMSPQVINVGEILIEEFNDQRVFSPTYQPNNVNIRDEVVYEDIDHIEMWGKPQGEWAYLRTLTDYEVFHLFNKNAMDYFTITLAPNIQLRVFFKKPLQIEEIETIAPPDFPMIPYPTSLSIDYYVFPTDLRIGEEYEGQSRLFLHQKISAFWISNPLPETSIDIAEIIAKKFIHVETSVHGSLDFKQLQRKTVDDVASAYIGEVPVPQGELEALFDGQCASYLTLPPLSALQVAFKVPNRIHSIKLLDPSGNYPVIRDLTCMVIYPGAGYAPFKTFDPQGEMIVKDEVIEVIIINPDQEMPLFIGELLCEEFNDQRVFSPVYQPNNVNIRDEVVYEDIQKIELWENAIQNGGWEYTRDLTTKEIFALFNKDVNDPDSFTLAVNQRLRVLFKKPLQIEEIEAVTPIVTQVSPFPQDVELDYTLYLLDAEPVIYEEVTKVTVQNKIAGFDMENPTIETELHIAEIIAKKFIHTQVQSSEVTIRDVKNASDFSRIFLYDHETRQEIELTEAEKAALFDKNPTTFYTLNGLGNYLTFMFKVPHRVHTIKVLDSVNGFLISSLGLSMRYAGLKTFPDEITVKTKLYAEPKDEVYFFTITNEMEMPIDIGEVIVEQFSDMRVHSPTYQPNNVNIRDEVVLEDIAKAEYWELVEQQLTYVRDLGANELFILFDKDTNDPNQNRNFLLPPGAMIKFIFKKPLQVEEIESLVAPAPPEVPYSVAALLDYVVYPTNVTAGEATEGVTVVTPQKKISAFDITNPDQEDTVYLTEVMAKKFIHAHVPSGESQVTIRDTKNASDFSSIALHVPELPDTELTDAQKAILFDKNPSTYFSLNPTEWLIFRFKVPHRVHTIKIGDRGAGMPIGQIGISLHYSGLKAFPDEVVVNDWLYAEPKDEVFTFYVANNSQAVLDIGEVIVEQFSDVRVHSPTYQPNNVNIRDEVVLEDISKVELWIMGEIELEYLRDLNAQELWYLFDKDAMNPNASRFVDLPPESMLRFILKKPLQVEEIQTIVAPVLPDVPWSMAATVDYTVYPTDTPVGEPTEGVTVITPRKKISAFDVLNPSVEVSIQVTKIMAKKFLHAHVPAASGAESTVVVRDVKNATDFSRVYISDIGGDHNLTPEEIATMFDQDMTTYYALPPSTMLRFVFKTNHNVHHVKLLDQNGNVIRNPSIFVNAKGTEPEMPILVDGRGYVDVKGEISGIDINNSDQVNPINIYEVIVKQMTYQVVEAPYEQPVAVFDQDYATPQDFDLLNSQSQSTPGISIDALISWLSQRSSGVQLPAFEVDPVIVLVPRNRALQVESIMVTEDVEGELIAPYNHAGASIVVYPMVGDPITALDTLWIPEIKCQVQKIVITLDHTQYWPRAFQIKKYVKRESFAVSQQPVKVEQDQEVTLQDVKAAQAGYLSGDGESTWVTDSELTIAQIKALFDKGNSSRFVTVPDDKGIRIQFKTPKYVDEVEFLDEYGLDLYIAPDTAGFTVYWQTMDGILIGGDILNYARAVVKAKIAAIIFYNATGAGADVYEAIIRLYNAQETFGQEFTNPFQDNVAVDDDGALALAANPRRKFAVFFNDSDVVIKLSLGAQLTFADAPIVLNPKGAFYEFNWTNLYRGAVYAITDTDEDGVLKVIEGV